MRRRAPYLFASVHATAVAPCSTVRFSWQVHPGICDGRSFLLSWIRRSGVIIHVIIVFRGQPQRALEVLAGVPIVWVCAQQLTVVLFCFFVLLFCLCFF